MILSYVDLPSQFHFCLLDFFLFFFFLFLVIILLYFKNIFRCIELPRHLFSLILNDIIWCVHCSRVVEHQHPLLQLSFEGSSCITMVKYTLMTLSIISSKILSLVHPQLHLGLYVLMGL